MEHKTVQMIGRSPAGIKSLVSALKRDLDADLITESCRAFSGAYAVLLCFEKYYFRNNSYAGLTIMLTEEQENQTADIIGFGGGNGLFNFSLGANSNFADTAIHSGKLRVSGIPRIIRRKLSDILYITKMSEKCLAVSFLIQSGICSYALQIRSAG